MSETPLLQSQHGGKKSNCLSGGIFAQILRVRRPNPSTVCAAALKQWRRGKHHHQLPIIRTSGRSRLQFFPSSTLTTVRRYPYHTLHESSAPGFESTRRRAELDATKGKAQPRRRKKNEKKRNDDIISASTRHEEKKKKNSGEEKGLLIDLFRKDDVDVTQSTSSFDSLEEEEETLLFPSSSQQKGRMSYDPADSSHGVPQDTAYNGNGCQSESMESDCHGGEEEENYYSCLSEEEDDDDKKEEEEQPMKGREEERNNKAMDQEQELSGCEWVTLGGDYLILWKQVDLSHGESRVRRRRGSCSQTFSICLNGYWTSCKGNNNDTNDQEWTLLFPTSSLEEESYYREQDNSGMVETRVCQCDDDGGSATEDEDWILSQALASLADDIVHGSNDFSLLGKLWVTDEQGFPINSTNRRGRRYPSAFSS